MHDDIKTVLLTKEEIDEELREQSQEQLLQDQSR